MFPYYGPNPTRKEYFDYFNNMYLNIFERIRKDLSFVYCQLSSYWEIPVPNFEDVKIFLLATKDKEILTFEQVAILMNLLEKHFNLYNNHDQMVPANEYYTFYDFFKWREYFNNWDSIRHEYSDYLYS